MAGKEKPLTSQTSACLANTNENTGIVSLELAKGISSHTITKRALIQMPGIEAQLSRRLGSNEDCGFRMKA